MIAGHRSTRSNEHRRKRAEGVVIGFLIALEQAGAVHVDFPGAPADCLAARTIVPLSSEQVGREVVLMFEEGDPRRPVIMGVLQPTQSPGSTTTLRTKVDGETIVFSAEKEITLKCGQASLTLTHEGKILLRGNYIVSRSSGVNRILGGSIELN
jgi:hypothetical protein